MLLKRCIVSAEAKIVNPYLDRKNEGVLTFAVNLTTAKTAAKSTTELEILNFLGNGSLFFRFFVIFVRINVVYGF